MRAWLAIVPAAACGGSPAPALTNTASPGGVAACPADAELAALGRRTWGSATENAWCVALRRGTASYWWIAAEVAAPAGDDAMDGKPRAWALVGTDGTVAWKHTDPASPFGFELSRQDAVDLDGDGIDEVVYHQRFGEGGVFATELVVVSVTGEPRFATTHLGGGSIDGGDCDAGYQVVPAGRARRVEITRTGACDTLAARERLRWDGHALAK
jgi:hypothetical protein